MLRAMAYCTVILTIFGTVSCSDDSGSPVAPVVAEDTDASTQDVSSFDQGGSDMGSDAASPDDAGVGDADSIQDTGADVSVDVEPDVPVEPPEITVLGVTTPVYQGEVATVTFSVSLSVPWAATLVGEADALAGGNATADESIALDVPTDELAPGAYDITLLAGQGDVATTTTVRLTVRPKLKLLVVYGAYYNNGQGPLYASAFANDVRVGMADLDYWLFDLGDLPSDAIRDSYDVIVFAYDYGGSLDSERAKAGNWLDAYLAQGGAVVMVAGANSIGQPLGLALTNQRLPLLRTSPEAPFVVTDAATLDAVDAAHPSLAGVTALTTQARARTELASGATLVAAWSDGLPLIATKGAVIAVTAYLRPNDTTLGGDWQRLLRNAVFWAHAQVP